jgi:hypothetical protein
MSKVIKHRLENINVKQEAVKKNPKTNSRYEKD